MQNPNLTAEKLPKASQTFDQILSIFVTTGKGLEKPLFDEVQEVLSDFDLPYQDSVIEAFTGCSLKGTWDTVIALNMNLMCASRVLVHVGEGWVKDESDLVASLSKISWEKIFSVHDSFAVVASCFDAYVTNSHFLALKVKDVICDRFREVLDTRPDVNVDDPKVRVQVRLQGKSLLVSLDTSGESLDKRGYRKELADASLRETLAAGILRLAGWNKVCRDVWAEKEEFAIVRVENAGDELRRIPAVFPLQPVLFDPMCGSGTIPIEAALALKNRKPNAQREHFMFLNLYPVLKSEIAAAWKVLRQKTIEREIEPSRLPRYGDVIFGSDILAKNISTAKANAKRAGVDDIVAWDVGDALLTMPPAESGMMVINAPYGERIGAQLAELYKDVGDHWKKNYKGWANYIYSGNPEALKSVGLRPTRKYEVPNANLEARLHQFLMY